MAFRGWTDVALEFFEGLEADNTKPFWEAHKPVYEAEVRAPMEELLAELEPDFGKGKIFRPYRDIRFSRDKSPYKTNIAARVGEGYVQLSADGLAAGAGMWELSADQLDRYRRAVDAEGSGEQLRKLVGEARKGRIQVMSHGELKTAPKGYPKEHPRIELLRYKGLVTWREWPPAPWLGTKSAKSKLIDFFERSRPVGDWLREHVGTSTPPTRR